MKYTINIRFCRLSWERIMCNWSNCSIITFSNCAISKFRIFLVFSSFTVGWIVSNTRKLNVICGIELYISDYTYFVYIFIFLMILSLAFATQLNFKVSVFAIHYSHDIFQNSCKSIKNQYFYFVSYCISWLISAWW